jgi:phage tail sheath protein FI
VGTIPVYVGTAPAGQLADFSGAVNKPILVNSFDEAKAAVGYSDDFANYTLCEAIDAHFRNGLQPIGPIILINVLNPATHKTQDQTAHVVIAGGKGAINNNKVVLNTITVAGKVQGTDFKAYYSDDGSQVILEEIVAGSLGASVDPTFDEMKPDAITAAEVIGTYNAETDTRTGSYCIELIYQLLNVIPTILLAPGWTEDPTVEQALLARNLDINGHWDTTVFADLDASAAGTVAAAQTWKTTNTYDSKYEKVFWPMAKKGAKVYHLSTLAAVIKQIIDYNNGNIPYESPSNKQLDITGLCLADGTAVNFDEKQANVLNSKGITTCIFSGGKWVLWGPHMANYEYGVTDKPEDVFDVSVWMEQYLNNDFQYRNMGIVDAPIDRRDIDYILNNEQQRLNALIADGKLLYGKIEFRASSNPTSDIIQGDFVFDSAVTYTPVGKSLTQQLQYTTAGISTLTGGEA